LPSLAYTSDEHTPVLDESFTIQKNACCDLVPLLDLFFLPKEHACDTMDLVLDYAIAGTSHVPSYFQVFQKRNEVKLSHSQKCFLSLIYQNCGEVGELSNRMFQHTFRSYQGGQRPFEWLLWQVYQYFFFKNDVIGKKEGIQQLIDTNKFIGLGPRNSMIKPRQDLGQVATSLLLPPDIDIDGFDLHLHGYGYPKFFFRGGKWEKEDSSQEWRFQNEYADGCAFPFPEYSNAQAIYELIIMDEDLPTGKGGYLKAWLKTDLPTKEESEEIDAMRDLLFVTQEKGPKRFYWRAYDNRNQRVACAAENQQSLFRKIYRFGLNGQNRFKNWRTCLKTKRDDTYSDAIDREEEDGYLSNGSNGSGTRSDVSIDDDDSIYVEKNAMQMAIMEERDIVTRSKSKQLREDATQNDLSDTDEEDSNNGTQSVVVARNTNACRQATRQSPVRTRSTSRFTGATQRR
jgi:hypothetical protein